MQPVTCAYDAVKYYYTLIYNINGPVAQWAELELYTAVLKKMCCASASRSRRAVRLLGCGTIKTQSLGADWQSGLAT